MKRTNKRKSYYYTTNWEEYPLRSKYVKAYYDNQNAVVYLRKLLATLNTGDSVLLDSISSIAPSWDVLIKTLEIFKRKSIDLCLDTGLGYSVDVCPQMLLDCVAEAISNGTCIHCLNNNIEQIILNQIEILGDGIYA